MRAASRILTEFLAQSNTFVPPVRPYSAPLLSNLYATVYARFYVHLVLSQHNTIRTMSLEGDIHVQREVRTLRKNYTRKNVLFHVKHTFLHL